MHIVQHSSRWKLELLDRSFQLLQMYPSCRLWFLSFKFTMYAGRWLRAYRWLPLGSGAIIEPLTNDRRSPLELAKIAGHGNVMTVLRKALSMQCLVSPLSVEEKELIFQHHTCQQQQLSTGRDDCLYPGNRGRNKVAAKITDTIFAGRHPGTYASVPALRFIWSRPTTTLCGCQV